DADPGVLRRLRRTAAVCGDLQHRAGAARAAAPHHARRGQRCPAVRGLHPAVSAVLLTAARLHHVRHDVCAVLPAADVCLLGGADRDVRRSGERGAAPAKRTPQLTGAPALTLTSQLMPKRSMHMPKMSPQAAFSMGIVTMPPSASLSYQPRSWPSFSPL